MKINYLRVNHLKNPLGYGIEKPVFSWIVEESAGKYQAKAQVEISPDADFKRIVHDSGRVKTLNSLGYSPEIALTPCTRYYWRVSVWDDAGACAVSETAWMETAKMDRPWEAEWITTPYEKKVHPMFYKRFEVGEEPACVRAYVCGLGLYDLHINGRKAGDEVLAPFYNDYNNWLQYVTYDLTELVHKGENAVAALLGNGWYKGRFGFIDGLDELYGDSFLFLCEIHITYEDGSTEIIGTDDTWNCHPSPVLESSIYDGEVYDARLEVPGFDMPDNALEGYVPAQKCALKVQEKLKGLLQPRLSPPLRVVEKLEAACVIHTSAGETVIDFGQNMTGWFAVRCREKAGQKIRISCSEILQDGAFYNENLRTAKEELIFISNGNECVIHPHFTFYGFRYLKVEGMEEVRPKDFEGWVIYSDIEETGWIETSNEKVNQLFRNTKWGQKGNFLDVPTDCPQRDERMGWTGDAQIFADTASFHMETAAFYHKYLYDMALEQQELSGAVPHVVPDILGQIMHKTNQENSQFGSCAWGDAACVIPWTLYLHYGDEELLRSHYPGMKMWVEFIQSVDERYHCGRLWKHGFHFADWLALDNPEAKDCVGKTNPYYVASAYYYYSAHLLSEAAQVLGYREDAENYAKLTREVLNAIREAYFLPDGTLTIDTQTAYALALYMHLVPDENQPMILKKLLERLDERDGHLDTGFVGTPYLCPVLSENGADDYAYSLLLKEDYPSWLYEVNMGATTIWERWNSVLPDGHISDTGMNSLNHYAYGSIAGWMYRYMAGFQPLKEGAGCKKVRIAPHMDKRLSFVNMKYRSAVGVYRLEWFREKDEIIFRIEIPFDAEAQWVLPAGLSEAWVNGEQMEGREITLNRGNYEIRAV